MNCTLINQSTGERVVFRTKERMTWIDFYEGEEIVDNLGMNEDMAESLKKYLLENTHAVVDPYNGVNVTYK